MKIKKSLSILVTALCLIACDKNAPPPSNPDTVSVQESNSNEVKQKLYTLTQKQCIRVINNFKEFAKSTSFQSKLASISLQADSSIWILEAAVNYDFDMMPNSNETTHDSCGFEINYTTPNQVANTDLLAAYSYFTSYITQAINGQKKVKLIDISAYTNNNKLTYSAHVVYFNYTGTQKISSPCDAYTTESGKWSGAFWGSSCPSNTYGDGPTMVNNKLNCAMYDPGCQSWYWTSITTTNIGNTTGIYSPNLFYVASTVAPCNTFGASQLNTYISNCKAYGTSNHPGGSYYLIDYNVWPGAIWLGGISWKIFWNLDIRYGIPYCNYGGGNG